MLFRSRALLESLLWVLGIRGVPWEHWLMVMLYLFIPCRQWDCEPQSLRAADPGTTRDSAQRRAVWSQCDSAQRRAVGPQRDHHRGGQWGPRVTRHRGGWLVPSVTRHRGGSWGLNVTRQRRAWWDPSVDTDPSS